ncbi:pentatricopeptide repeat-containing protein [Canna indica]|uniref:Pentatricopeptide repeat-containing protein n=1 Tax=Canna indica TaxID=4628 RepID=A0AAQ3K0X7_9LILI|nr:pentatricopeptide repeat-containing protein [Canna indica]
MILRGRGLRRATSIRVIESLRAISIKSPDNSRLRLCPEIVQSTVSACPSDTIALSFFLWCARQPNYFHDSCSFDRMIPVVCRLTDRFGSVGEIVRELEVAGCSIKAQTFMILIRVYWRGNFYGLALEVFDEMVKRNYVPNTYARNMILDILFKTCPLDVATKFFRSTKSPNFLSYNIVLSNLCRSSDWLGARDVLREMVDNRFDLNTWTLTIVFDCFCKAGRFMELLQLLAFMIVSGKQPTATIWTILIDNLCRTGKVDRASMLLTKMIHMGCSPTVATYTSLLRGLFESQKFDKVSTLLDTMLSNECSPDLVFYNVLIDCFSKSRRYDDALEIFLRLGDKRLKPDAYTLSSLICTLCSSGQLSSLPKLIAGLDISLDLVACNSLINAFCKAGLPLQAIEFFIYMVNRDFSPDNYSYAGLLNGLCMLGRIDKAVDIYLSFVANNPNVDEYVHAVIITGLVKQKKYHMAIRLFRKALLQNYCLDVVSYTIAITGLFRGGRFEEAESLFDQMKHSGVVPNTYTYNVMLYGFCKARDIVAVKQWLRHMETAGFDLDHISFNTIIRLLTKLHRSDLALRLCRRMGELGMMPNSITYSLILDSVVDVSAGEPLCQTLMSNSKSPHCMESSLSHLGNELLVCSAN